MIKGDFMKADISPVEIRITGKLLDAVAEEMGIVLRKSSLSPNIKERRDFSCAVFDARGRMLAQAAHIPVHLGAMPLTVEALLKRFEFAPGDVIITNDPFSGGTHLPDITLMQGVHVPGFGKGPLFYIVNRAHHADVGGVTPGSMPLATSIEDEGLLIKPGYIVRAGKTDSEFLNRLVQGMRNPAEREGDLMAQLYSLERGAARLCELAEGLDPEGLSARCQLLLDYGMRVMEDIIDEMPDGTFAFADYLDDDGLTDEPVRIEAALAINGKRAVVDFRGSDSQVKTGLNTVRSVTCSAVYYCFFCLVGQDQPVNHGSLLPVEIKTRWGTVVDAMPGSPVAAGNVETSQRIVDVVLGAMSQAMPDRVPAASCGTMNNIAIGSAGSRGAEFAYYETIGGGMGARPGADGLSAVQVHMTNTLNTPVEVIEQEYPMHITEYAIRRNSGGHGDYMGGDGIRRRYRFLAPASVTLLTERRRLAPYGLRGGGPGKKGRNIFYKKQDGRSVELAGKVHLEAEEGDELVLFTPGGGGLNNPG